MSTVRTAKEAQVLAAITAATSLAEREYNQNEAVLTRQGISQEQYVRSRLKDANVPTAFAEPASYEELVRALADGKPVDQQRQDAILRMSRRTEADLQTDVVNL